MPVGLRQRRPDFTTLHPRRGLLVLEVKDWKPATLKALDKDRALIRGDSGEKTVANPLLQARMYALELVHLLQHDHASRTCPGTRTRGTLHCRGVTASCWPISRAMFEMNELGHVLAEHLVICQDEMTERVDAEAFQRRLWAMFNVHFGTAITGTEEIKSANRICRPHRD